MQPEFEVLASVKMRLWQWLRCDCRNR